MKIDLVLEFIFESKIINNFRLRSGDAYTTNTFTTFLADTLSRFAEKTVSLLRANSGFFVVKIIHYLEIKTSD